MSSFGPCPTSIFFKAWCQELDTKLQPQLHWCQVEHNNFFCVLHKTLTGVFWDEFAFSCVVGRQDQGLSQFLDL